MQVSIVSLLQSRGITIDFSSAEVHRHTKGIENWVVHLVDTGLADPHRRPAQAGLTYGDGVSDVDLRLLLAFHRSCGRMATVTAVRPPASAASTSTAIWWPSSGRSPRSVRGINGGFMVFEPGVFDYLTGDDGHLEVDALERLAADGQLAAYRHESFWQCMDTLRDLRYLESLWDSGRAPWKTW